MQKPNAATRTRPRGAASGPRPRWRWALALLALHLVFVFPGHPDSVGLRALLRVPVELPIAVLILLVWPSRLRAFLRPVVMAGLGLLVLTRFADLAAQASLGRPFHPLLDMHLAGAGFELLAGAIGLAGAAALAAAAVLAWIASVALVCWATGALRPADDLRWRLAGAAAAAATLVGGAHLSASAGLTPAVTTAEASRSVRDHVRALRHSLTDRARFRAERTDDVFAKVPSDRLLARLRGIDVVFLFVESYGRSTLENRRYAPTVQRALADFEQAAEAAGFDARSAWLSAPIRGGQSWLAHATLLAGLRIDNQRRYESLILSDRQTLAGDFQRAGWRTLAVLPATDRPWPEGRFFGFDRIYAANDLGYAGEPFNWVTMPDQYTLSALQRLELDHRDRPAIMATVALISSHAPWTPIPPVLDWDAVGDGSVFTAHARAGDPPEVVWLDPERIRAQYLHSIEYVLRTLKSWVVAHGRDHALFVVVGDHQPLGIVAGEGASFDVPIHILTRDRAVVDAIADWGWSPGMRPDSAAPAWPMEAIRERFLAAFTAEAESTTRPEASRPTGPPAVGRHGSRHESPGPVLPAR